MCDNDMLEIDENFKPKVGLKSLSEQEQQLRALEVAIQTYRSSYPVSFDNYRTTLKNLRAIQQLIQPAREKLYLPPFELKFHGYYNEFYQVVIFDKDKKVIHLKFSDGEDYDELFSFFETVSNTFRTFHPKGISEELKEILRR